MSDIINFIISFILVNVFTFIANTLADKKIVSPSTSRKMVHISLGVCQMLLWPLYSEDSFARLWGSMCCIIYLFIFLIFGLEIIKGPFLAFLIKTVCREGKAKEMLYGPFNYCCIMNFMSLLFWKNSPYPIIGLMIMLTGDGMAEIVGKNLGKHHMVNPWGSKKTLEGSMGIAIFGALGAMIMCYLNFGSVCFLPCVIGGIVVAVTEFYAYPNYDNVFIPLVVAGVDYALHVFGLF